MSERTKIKLALALGITSSVLAVLYYLAFVGLLLGIAGLVLVLPTKWTYYDNRKEFFGVAKAAYTLSVIGIVLCVAASIIILSCGGSIARPSFL